MTQEALATARLVNERGLHARAGARFVKCANTFQAQVAVHYRVMEVVGTSIMGLLMLGAPCGAEVELHAKGKDAKKVLEVLVALIEEGFGEGKEKEDSSP